METLLTQEIIDQLDACEDNFSSYAYRQLQILFDFISGSVDAGRFSEEDAHHDLEIALRIAYSCNNIDDYEHYYMAAEWLAPVEDLAHGCGVWYYRYANALMYCGEPEKARDYLERGVQEDPEYPWAWLTLARLRSHFGDKAGALEANARGLALVPGDYEFTRQQTELEQGKTLEEMENHYINEEADRKLMEGLLTEERDEKLFAISGIVCNRPQLSENLAALEISGWVPNTPYCFGTIPHGTEGTQFTAMMNEAAFSKVSPVWLAELRSRIPDLDRQALEWLEHRFPDLPEDIRLGEIRLYRAHELQLSYSPASGGDGLSLPVSKDWSISDPGFWGDTWKLAVSAESRSLFTAILLLENPDWDWEQLCRDLKSDWGISCKLSEKQPNRLMFESDSLLGTLTLGNFPIPNGEAEQIAANNYLWSEAVETVGRHQANIVAAVFGKGAAPVDSGKLLVKLCASCCRQENVLGVYTSGTVFQPSFYLRSALVMRDGDLPVLDWIYFGLYRSDNGISGYTYGLENFGKREIEVLDSNTKPVELRDFLFNIAYYILDNDMEFHDGETIGFSEHQKLPITLSAGVAVDGMSFNPPYRKKPVTKSK